MNKENLTFTNDSKISMQQELIKKKNELINEYNVFGIDINIYNNEINNEIIYTALFYFLEIIKIIKIIDINKLKNIHLFLSKCYDITINEHIKNIQDETKYTILNNTIIKQLFTQIENKINTVESLESNISEFNKDIDIYINKIIENIKNDIVNIDDNLFDNSDTYKLLVYMQSLLNIININSYNIINQISRNIITKNTDNKEINNFLLSYIEYLKIFSIENNKKIGGKKTHKKMRIKSKITNKHKIRKNKTKRNYNKKTIRKNNNKKIKKINNKLTLKYNI